MECTMSASGKLLSAVALLLSGCQPNSSGHSSVGAGEGRQLKGVPPFLIPPARTPPDSLALDFEVPAAVRAGDSVSLQVTLRNAVGRHLLLRLGGAPPTIDCVITRLQGTEVWRLQHGEGAVYDDASFIPLAPGEVLEFTGAWDQRNNAGEPVPPGTYCVRAVVPLAGPGLQRELVTEVMPLLVADSPPPDSTANCSGSD